jgi:Arc/MetJ-type ribon-helix-helix transcriptional regulator
MTLNVNLGEPYEKFIKDIMKRGYASSQTEVIRQALAVYRREMESDEERRVAKAVESEMKFI